MRRSATCLVWVTLCLSACRTDDSAEVPSAGSKPSAGELAYAYTVLIPQIEARGEEHGFTEDDTWTLRDMPLSDELGYAFARFDRRHAGIRVVGGDIITRSTLERGLPVDQIVSRLSKPITTNLEALIDEDDARRTAFRDSQRVEEGGAASLVLWAVDAHREQPRLAWEVEVGMRRVIVSADDGKVIDGYATIHTGECGEDITCTVTSLTARPFYRRGTFSIIGARRSRGKTFVDFGMHDLLRDIRVRESSFRRRDVPDASDPFGPLVYFADLSHGSTLTSTQTEIGNGRLYDGRDSETSPDRFTPAGELMLNLDRVYGFYSSRYDRYGFAGRRTACLEPPGHVHPCIRGTEPIIATVNVPMSSAAFEPRFDAMWFGYDPARSPTRGPLVELDIVAHEFTHGVTSRTANLIYSNGESGALNESVSDVFGRVVTFAYDPATVDSDEAWWVGAGLTTPLVAGDAALRYMDDPTRDGRSLRHVSDFPAGGIDPHYGSGIPNLVFALVARSIGWEPAADIWYRSLTTCFTESTTFHDARVCTVAAAEALHPEQDDIPNQVKSAWDGVGVY